MDGIINVYKEQGFTSHDVVAKLRGILRTRKIGHTGTLDPQAEGVLPVCVGSATKLCDMLTEKDKIYEAVMLLGVETDTQDTTGTVLTKKPLTSSQGEVLSPEAVSQVIASYVGTYQQIPPMYSALKVNGQKLCDLARKGITVEREARPVTIYDIEIREIALPRVTLRVSCSKGTYIRTLLHDMGQTLGCGACMERLVRVRAGHFSVEDSLTLGQIEALRDSGALDAYVMAPDTFFPKAAKFGVVEEGIKYLANGNMLTKACLTLLQSGDESRILVYNPTGIFCGLYDWNEEKNGYCAKKMFYVGL